MNIKALTLSIISVAAAVAASAPAQAQEGPQAGGARWHFAPNYYKIEQPNLPRGYNAPATTAAVKSGAVPSKNVLGLDPTYLAKAPAPMAAPLIRNTQAVSAVPLKPAAPLEAFKAAFGRPISVAPPMMAALPQSMSATPASTAPSAARSVSGHLRPRTTPVSRTAGVAGRLLTPQHRPAPVPAVANYGSLGFTPGPMVPSSGSTGSGASTSVSAKLYRR